MKPGAFSLVEVMVAAAVVAVGLTAAAMLVGSLMQQQEVNAASFRASNLQEQAAKLFRMDLNPSLIREVLPEVSVGTTVPPAGGYSFVFSRPAKTNLVVDNTTLDLEVGSMQIIYESPLGSGTYATNRVSILRPATRVEYDQ